MHQVYPLGWLGKSLYQNIKWKRVGEDFNYVHNIDKIAVLEKVHVYFKSEAGKNNIIQLTRMAKVFITYISTKMQWKLRCNSI